MMLGLRLRASERVWPRRFATHRKPAKSTFSRPPIAHGRSSRRRSWRRLAVPVFRADLLRGNRSGALTLIQSRVRPDRYGESARLLMISAAPRSSLGVVLLASSVSHSCAPSLPRYRADLPPRIRRKPNLSSEFYWNFRTGGEKPESARMA